MSSVNGGSSPTRSPADLVRLANAKWTAYVGYCDVRFTRLAIGNDVEIFDTVNRCQVDESDLREFLQISR